MRILIVGDKLLSTHVSPSLIPTGAENLHVAITFAMLIKCLTAHESINVPLASILTVQYPYDLNRRTSYNSNCNQVHSGLSTIKSCLRLVIGSSPMPLLGKKSIRYVAFKLQPTLANARYTRVCHVKLVDLGPRAPLLARPRPSRTATSGNTESDPAVN